MAIATSPSTIYMLRNWLIAFIFFELAKCYTQLQLSRSLDRDQTSLAGVSTHTHVLVHAADYLSFAWFLYGSVLYHYTNPQEDLGVIFSSFFGCVLVYGYSFMLRHVFERTIVLCVTPLWTGVESVLTNVGIGVSYRNRSGSCRKESASWK